MNIFVVHKDPHIAASMMVDKHVVKMILESAQLLSTAHRMLDGVETTELSKTNRKIKRWKFNDDRDQTIYQATHINHPCSVWVRQSAKHYEWLYEHFLALINEYKFRYDNKPHKCEALIPHLKNTPQNISQTNFVDPPAAMDDKYIISKNVVENYRNYYKFGKKHLHKWSIREAPSWIT